MTRDEPEEPGAPLRSSTVNAATPIAARRAATARRSLIRCTAMRARRTFDALSRRRTEIVPARQGGANDRTSSTSDRLRVRHRCLRRGACEAAAGLTLLAAALVLWHLATPPGDFGDPGRLAAAEQDPSAHGELPGPRVIGTGIDPESPVDESHLGPASDVIPGGNTPTPITEPRLPLRIRIDRRQVDAAIVPVGVRHDGAMDIPRDVQEVGWYAPGPLPGRSGTAVLAGHVDSATQGRGAFFDLRLLELGDEIEILHDDGSRSSWVVQARRKHRKEDLPVDAIFASGGDPRLVLITCGGVFDVEAERYRDNVVVHASPAVRPTGQASDTES